MSFFKDVRDFMNRHEVQLSTVENYKKVITLLMKENELLREQNGRLFDRLMAKDFDNYTQNVSTLEESFVPSEEFSDDKDEGLVGEVYADAK